MLDLPDPLVTDLLDYAFLLPFLLGPTPLLPQQAMQETVRIAAFSHISLACSQGKSDYNSISSICCNKKIHHKDDHYEGKKKPN